MYSTEHAGSIGSVFNRLAIYRQIVNEMLISWPKLAILITIGYGNLPIIIITLIIIFSCASTTVSFEIINQNIIRLLKKL